jgi:hypothetical protein
MSGDPVFIDLPKDRRLVLDHPIPPTQPDQRLPFSHCERIHKIRAEIRAAATAYPLYMQRSKKEAYSITSSACTSIRRNCGHDNPTPQTRTVTRVLQLMVS